ncbi:MAG: hypothetical protein ACLGGX_08935 [Bdellovibrionia bacterium]
MNTFKHTLLSLVIAPLLLASPSVQADSSSYEEISYEDLVEKLSAKKSKYVPTTEDPFLGVQIHTGIGFVNSFSYFKINDQVLNRHQNGVQLSLGMDLFSPQWFSEASFRNYGLTETGSEEWTVREFDLRIGYKEQLDGPWGYSLHTGLANRFFDLRDRVKDINESGQTPAMMIGLGVTAKVHRQLQFGFDVINKSPIVGDSADKGSLDLTVKVSASL